MKKVHVVSLYNEQEKKVVVSACTMSKMLLQFANSDPY